MSDLKDLLIAQITREGPISVADYMTQCLFHPEHGYYTTNRPIGGAGDFITAPEISQMFGELIGLALAQAWLDQGRPSPFTLAELGPGNGTLMRDALRATAGVDGFHAAMNLHLVEVSQSLRAAQRETLAGYDVMWLDSASDLPADALFLIANEFLDCLPIRQFSKTDLGWQEQMVGAQDGALHFALGAVAKEIAVNEDRDFIELCPSAVATVEYIADLVAQQGGLALFVDYGDAPPNGDTFQALKAHQKTDPLAEPGHADLTAHVDFAALKTAAESVGAATYVTTQGLFLEMLGITARAQALSKTLSGEPLETLISAHRRLTHPVEMGTLFKAFAITKNTAPPPPGFTP